MEKILITEFMDAAAVAKLSAKFAVTYDPDLGDRRADLWQKMADVTVLIVRNRTQVDGELLAAAPQLKIVGRLGVGLDNIALDLCQARKIRVIPATGANAQAVAEYVLATAMMLRRGSYFSTSQVAAGQWPRAALSHGHELRGSILGLVGFGNIGQTTARLFAALGVTIIAYDPALAATHEVWANLGVKKVSLDELFRESDIVSLHIPALPETRNLVNAERLALMQPGKTRMGKILINTSRGEVVDIAAVAAALRSGHLGGAALDVFAPEPLTAALAAAAGLVDCPNLILTPHIAGVTHEANIRVSTLIADKVTEFLTSQ
ncbi:MAG: hydroxyacid dehydrogenase [Candidatus Symbiobacter sp.]|nr:hydroxyacid dehydrogenase [Candidatus Symbiobacter sp.]